MTDKKLKRHIQEKTITLSKDNWKWIDDLKKDKDFKSMNDTFAHIRDCYENLS